MVHEQFDEFSTLFHQALFISINENWSHYHLIKSIQILGTSCIYMLLLTTSGIIWMIDMFILAITVIHINTINIIRCFSSLNYIVIYYLFTLITLL